MRFFSLVQNCASARHCVFFLECGDGRDFSGEEMEGEDLQGYLIPKEKADDFEREWLSDQIGERWEDCFCFAVWKMTEHALTVDFEFYE